VLRHSNGLILAALGFSLIAMLCVAIAVGSTPIALSDVIAARFG